MDYLFKTTDDIQSACLVAAKEIVGMEVQVSPPKLLNQSKGVVVWCDETF